MPAMLAEPKAKQGRFNARLSKQQKAILQRAADLKGVSLSDFVLGAAHDEALQIIRSHEIIRLSQRDSAAFLEALEKPPIAKPDVVERFSKARNYRAK